MNSSSKRIIKRVAIGIAIFSIGFFGLIFYGLHLMDVEDRYGDLQNLYWHSKDGDLIFNKVNSKIGVVELDKNRIYVRVGTRLIHVEEWLDPEDKRKFHAIVYRPKQQVDELGNVQKNELPSKSKLITEIVVEY